MGGSTTHYTHAYTYEGTPAWGTWMVANDQPGIGRPMTPVQQRKTKKEWYILKGRWTWLGKGAFIDSEISLHVSYIQYCRSANQKKKRVGSSKLEFIVTFSRRQPPRLPLYPPGPRGKLQLHNREGPRSQRRQRLRRRRWSCLDLMSVAKVVRGGIISGQGCMPLAS